MFEDPEETPSEDAIDPKSRVEEKVTEFRMYAELAAVFEGPRKFEAQVLNDLDESVARQIQKAVAQLEKKRVSETAVLPDGTAATELLRRFETDDLSTNDYHFFREDDVVMICRWLTGEQVASFYERYQAHFDAGLNHYRDDERQAHAWKQDETIDKVLESLDAVDLKMPDRYLRDQIRTHSLFALSTQTADELNISFLTDTLMTIPAADLVGDALAPSDGASDFERTWFFKLFSLRGMVEAEERMMFFAFLQKSDEG